MSLLSLCLRTAYSPCLASVFIYEGWCLGSQEVDDGGRTRFCGPENYWTPARPIGPRTEASES